MRILMMLGLGLATAWIGSVVAQKETTGAVERQLNPVSSFSTSLNPGQDSRNHNIRLAASILNGREIRSRQIFSFNETIGPRSAEAGFLKAPYLEFGEKFDLEGGGVCLVSSVLYNAALSAGMQIIERHPHSRQVPYLPPGLDATVDYGDKDLRFRNPWRASVFIETALSGNRLLMTLISPAVLFPDTFRTESFCSLQPNERLVVTTFRNYEKNGRMIRREFLSEDTYPPAGRGEPPSALKPAALER
jgi:vancomycin resistance protein YoaR